MIQFFTFIFSLLENLLKFIFDFIETCISAIPKKKQGYQASFAPEKELLSKHHTGFCLTGDKSLSAKTSYTNCLVVAQTGGGKSTIVLLPTCYSAKGSFIIHDPSGELFAKSSGYLKNKGYDIKILNFAKPENSSGYNPLVRANSSSEIQKVANMLVSTGLGGNSKDKFWESMSVSLLSSLIAILKKQPAEFQNLYNVRQLLTSLGANPEGVDALFSKHADSILFSEYKSFISHDDKITGGVAATAKAALQLFADESVARATAHDTISFEDFRKKPTALYIMNSVTETKYYSGLISIFFEQFFTYIFSHFPEDHEQDIWFLIDEASSLHIPTLPLALANIRKHRGGIMQLVQTVSQYHHYGKDNISAIKTNSFVKMYFPGQDLETARELEGILGKFEYKEKDKEGKDGQKVIKSLMTADEIIRMKHNTALIVAGSHKPILGKLTPFYENKKYLEYSKMPAPVIKSTAPDSVNVLPLPEIEKDHE